MNVKLDRAEKVEPAATAGLSESRVSLTGWVSVFDRGMASEVLRSEHRRVSILAATLAFFFLVFLILASLRGLMEEALHEKFQILFWPVSILFLVAVGYELGIRFWLAKLLKSGQKPAGFFSYVNAFIETSFPTLILLIASSTMGAAQVLVAPPILLYFLFIFLATLHLDFKLCLFTGAVAALEYMTFAFSVRGEIAPELYSMAAPHHFVLRGILFLVAGLVAGFVASQIRRQFAVSLRTVQERDRAISIFGQHVSPQVAEKLLTQSIDFDGELRNVCVMFLDIRDFSNFASKESPESVVRYLNKLFDFMISVVNENRGIVNKFLGDGFMAVFGAPVEDNDQCHHAATAALDIIRGVERMNGTGDVAPTRIGIGLHVGEAVTGNIGSAERKEYTIIGDTVNLAARVEQATKVLKAQLLVSEAVHRVLDPQRFPAEDLGPVELKGQPRPVKLYKIA
ncbi:MAG: adenylate/guanylate cyclase domain-containing protein [Planctomycetota bacterium]